MVVVCSAPGCSAKKDGVTSKSSVQFHRFPLRKPDVLAKWVKAMKCANFKPTATSYLCSAHFSASDYDLKTSNSVRHLKPNAVPSVFEKKRPGRKKKLASENEIPQESLENGEDYNEGKERSANTQEEYLEVEGNDKVQTNLAEIIGDQDKGTLHVLIVGEDGKITNSEYIFKKELFSDNGGTHTVTNDSARDTDDESMNQFKEKIGDKSSQTDASPEITVFSYKDLKNREKIKRLESALMSTRKKVKILQMRSNRMSKRMNELKSLLKLLVLKRGKGEKNLKQLLEEYERCESEELKGEVKEDDSDF